MIRATSGRQKSRTVLFVLLCALTGRAQQATTPPTLTDLEQQVQQLRQELSLLEAQLAAQAVQPTVQQESLVPPAAESLPKTERINFRGVGELASIGYYNTVFMSSAWPQTTVDPL